MADWASTTAGRLRFTTPALDAPLSIAGHAIVTLHLASDQADACVFVYLEDIAPDGSVHYVTEGMLRALHRKISKPSPTYGTAWPPREYTRKEACVLTPGETVELTFALLPTAWEFPKGNQIALSIAGADRDNFALWPYGRPGHWRIALGGGGGSRIELPVI